MLSDSVRKFCLNTAVVVGASAAALAVSRGLQSEHSDVALAAVVALPLAYALVVFIRAIRNAAGRLARIETRMTTLERHPWLADHCRPVPVKLRTVHVTKDDPGSAA